MAIKTLIFALLAGVSVSITQECGIKPLLEPFSKNCSHLSDIPIEWEMCMGPVCGNPASFLPDKKEFSEECVGTAKYCFENNYRKFQEDYNSTFYCLQDRGVNPDSLATKGVDRHFWDFDARLEGFQFIKNAHKHYTRFILTETMQNNLACPELEGHYDSINRINATLHDKEADRNKAFEAIEQAKRNLAKAYKTEFFNEISGKINKEVEEIRRTVKIDQLAQVHSSDDISTYLKKANCLLNRNFLLQNLGLDASFNDYKKAINWLYKNYIEIAKDKALNLPNSGEVINSIATALSAVEQAWANYGKSEKLRGVITWIEGHETGW